MTVSRTTGDSHGASWSTDDTIMFATNDPASGLLRVAAAGGEPEVLTTPNRDQGELGHRWPEVLPGGRAVLFTITTAGGLDNAQIAVLDLATREQKVLIRGGSHARYVPTGHLVYGVAGTLRAVAFDLRRLEVVGTPVPVLEQVITTRWGGQLEHRGRWHAGLCAGRGAGGAQHVGVGGSAGTRGAAQGAAAGLRVSAAVARWHARGARRARPGA